MISALLPESASEMRILLKTCELTGAVSLTENEYDESENFGGLSLRSSTRISRLRLTIFGSALLPFSSTHSKEKIIIEALITNNFCSKDIKFYTCKSYDNFYF